MTAVQREIRAEEADRTAPRCHKCKNYGPKVDLIACGEGSCDAYQCTDCATQAEAMLGACCDDHAASIALYLQQQVSALRTRARVAERRAA